MSKNYNTEESIVVRLLRYGVYAMAFIPLVIFSEFLSPFHFGKVIVFRSFVEIMLVLYLVLILSPGGKRYLPPKSKILWAFILFAIAFGITSYTGINPYRSFWGTLERMGGWFTFVHYLAFFTIAISILRKKEEWIRLLQISIFVSLLSAFYGFLQKTGADWIIGGGGRQKIFGTIGNPALFAGYILINTFLALMMFFRDETTAVGRRFFFSVFLLNSLAVLLSGVRGSVAGLVIGLLVFGFMHKSREIKKYTLIFLLLVAISATTLSLLHDTEFVKRNAYLDRYSDFSPKTYTVQTRIWAWTAGIQGWNDSAKTILLGYGSENFNYPFSFNFNPKFYQGPGSETLFDRAHNMFIEILVTMGIIGFISYIFLFGIIFAAIRRLGREQWVYKAGLTSLMVAYIIHNSFIFDTSANFIAFFIVTGFILFMDPATKKREIVSEEPVRISAGAMFLMMLLFAVVSVVIFKVNIRPVKANYATTRAIIATWNNDHNEAVKKYKEALSYDVSIKYEIRHRFAKYVIDGSNAKDALKNKSVVEILNFTIEEIEKNKKENPQDYLPHLYLSRLHIMLGRDDPNSPHNDIALEEAFSALEISPTFIRTYFEIAQAYLNKKDFNKAIESFQKAYELQPEASIIKWYLGMAYIDSGQIQKGMEYIEESGTSLNETQLLKMIEVFVKVNNFEKISEAYEKLIRIKPRSAQYHASLAVAYSQIGKIDLAVKMALKAAELDPSFAAESQAFINSLISGESIE